MDIKIVAEKDENYIKAISERQKYVDSILKSTSNKKVVVAGPGTGKTYLFKQILKNKNSSLTLTFVNSLVEDLSLELYGLSEVKTLHSFARSLLGKITKKNVKVFPKLSTLIKEDASIILNKDIDFDNLFYNLDDQNNLINFYKTRKDYYGDYYGYTDIIYAVLEALKVDATRTPTYDQVLVDEFQDFNKLEVSLIELLSIKNSILLAGDDDQALYGFKKASVKHIREKYSNSDLSYDKFSLPYCSRCTRVIVDAVNDIVEVAMKEGKLIDRVDKKYLYFDEKNKDKISEQNPTLIYKSLHSKQIPWFIKSQISKIAGEVKGKFTVLVISPTRTQSKGIARYLINNGFANVEYVEREKPEITLLDGLLILLEDKVNNLGWRIVSSFFMVKNEFQNLIRKSEVDLSLKFSEAISDDDKKIVLDLLDTLGKLKKDKVISRDKLERFMEKVDINVQKVVEEFFKNNFFAKKSVDMAVRRIPIKTTTIQSSKGLSDEYVFITHFDDKYFIEDKQKANPSDYDIYKFLVALTRSKKKVYLISSDIKKKPIFLEWIKPERVQIEK